MTATFMVVEVIGGFLSGSLALVADAGHMLTDSASIGVLADPDHVGDYDDMLRTLRRIANEEHGIAHTTIQLETSVRGCDGEDHHVDHLLERQMARKKRRFTFGHHH